MKYLSYNTTYLGRIQRNVTIPKRVRNCIAIIRILIDSDKPIVSDRFSFRVQRSVGG